MGDELDEYDNAPFRTPENAGGLTCRIILARELTHMTTAEDFFWLIRWLESNIASQPFIEK